MNSSKGIKRLDEYCQQTSLHGWAYVAKEKGVFKRLLWFASMAGFISLAIYFVAKNIKEYSEATTLTTVASTTALISDLNFPQVYACNLNKITRSGLKSIGSTDPEELLIVNKYRFGADMNTIDKLKFLKIVKRAKGEKDEVNLAEIEIHKCEGFIIKAKWSNMPLKLFMNATNVPTDIGGCCRLTPDWPGYEFHSNTEGSNDKNQTIMNGIQSGLMLTLDLEKFDYGIILDSYGAKIGLPSPMDIPIMRDIGFDIKSGELTEVAMIPTVIETTDDALSKFDPEDRGCYTTKEFDLRYRSSYSMNNCLYDAFLQKVIDDCKCAYNFDKAVLARNPTINGCGMKEKDLACSETLVKQIGSKEMDFAMDEKSGKMKKCLSKCKTQHINIIPTTLAYPADNFVTFKYHTETCLVMEKLTKICTNKFKKELFEEYYEEDITCKELIVFHEKNSIPCDGISYFKPKIKNSNDTKVLKFYHKYSKENLAKVAIYFRDPYYTKIVRDVKMTFTTFISIAGGLVGLCLGLSLVSLFELLYHFLKFLFDF